MSNSNYEIDYSSIDPTSVPPPPPPSSVHGEVDEDDHHLPVDDSFHHRDVIYDSVDGDEIQQDDNSISNDLNIDGLANQLSDGTLIEMQPPIFPTPQQPELTLKEKLVLRERQQRIETERARLKRQFALSSTNEESDNANEGEAMVDRNHIGTNYPTMTSLQDDTDDVNNNGQEFEEESTRAHPDEEEAAADEANRRLGFNMERFLRNSDSFNPELDNALEVNRTEPSGETTNDATKGVVMERFLNEANVFDNCNVAPAPLAEPHRSVSFDVDAAVETQGLQDSELQQTLDFHQDTLLSSMNPSFGEESGAGVSIVSNASMRTEANTARDEFFAVGDPPLYSTSSLENMHEADRPSQGDASSQVSDDEPRVLRLTEADMLEMAAIEEASIGNAPPSDRDEVESYSEIGELTDFGVSGGGANRFFLGSTFNGPDTPTTALESASLLSQRSANRGGASAVSSSATTEHVDDDIVSGHIDLINGIAIATHDTAHYFVASASASVAANPPSEGGRDEDDDEIMDMGSQLNDIDAFTGANRANDNDVIINFPTTFNSGAARNTTSTEDSADIVVGGFAENRQRRYNPNDSSIDGSRIDTTNQHDVVDGFDFDIDEPLSPCNNRHVHGALTNDDSFRNLPSDPWSPPGHLQISPLQAGVARGHPLIVISENAEIPMQYESNGVQTDSRPNLIDGNHSSNYAETAPLLFRNLPKLESLPQSQTDTSGSAAFSVLPDRQIALFFTMALEIPVLLMITGGSDFLCGVIGRSRYQLLIGFLPLTCAISGNAALQARAATTHAITNNIVTSASSYQTLFVREVAISVGLGISTGTAMGIFALCISGWDFMFGITILITQLFSIVTAGITGTLVPLLFKSITKRDATKWSELFVTAFQDMVGYFATIVLSYFIIVICSSRDVDPSDRCVIF